MDSTLEYHKVEKRLKEVEPDFAPTVSFYEGQDMYDFFDTKFDLFNGGDNRITALNNISTIDLVAMDKLYSSKKSPYVSLFSQEELDGVLNQIIDLYRLPHFPLSVVDGVRSAGGKRQKVDRKLTSLEKDYIESEIRAIKADRFKYRFDYGDRTGYFEDHDIVSICLDVFPDYNSWSHGDLISVRAVLAHEFWGHRYIGVEHPQYAGYPGSAEDESLASSTASRTSPGLRKLDKEQLVRDAVFRLKKHGLDTKVGFIDKIRFYDRTDEAEMKLFAERKE